MAKIEDEIVNLYRHRSFVNARFTLSALVLRSKKYNIVMQIVEYESGNFVRSLQFVTRTYTSRYYEALAYREIGELRKALATLHGILDDEIADQEPFGNSLDTFLLRSSMDVIFELLGEIYQNVGEKEKSLRFYKKAVTLNKNSYKSFIQLFVEKAENTKVKKGPLEKTGFVAEKVKGQKTVVSRLKAGSNIDAVVDSELEKVIETPFLGNDSKENECLKTYFIEMKNGTGTTEESFKKRLLERTDDAPLRVGSDEHDDAIDNIVSSFYADLRDPETHVEKYKAMCPGIGSYFLAEVATLFSEEERIDDSLVLFEFVRRKERVFTYNMDVYSTILYRKQEKDKLALLSRDLLKYSYHSNITWSVLGNYYSLMGDNTRSILCLKRSLEMHMSCYTAALIGHEYYHKKDLEQAQSYFNLSLLLCGRNYNALVGLGLSYFSLGQPDNGIFYIRKAIQMNPKNLMIKYILVKYALRAENHSESLATLEDVFKNRPVGTTKEKRALGLYAHISTLKRGFSEVEEMMLMELCMMLVDMRQHRKAEVVLNMVQCRSPSYQKVKNLVFAGFEKKE